MDDIQLDFEEARATHLQFKSRLRSVLYGNETDEFPVLSHFECNLGKWIYGHALKAYGHVPEMQELEKVHTGVHSIAKELVTLYKYGKIDEARTGLHDLEKTADQLAELLTVLEKKLGSQSNQSPSENIPASDLKVEKILKANMELEKENLALKEKIKELEKKLRQ